MTIAEPSKESNTKNMHCSFIFYYVDEVFVCFLVFWDRALLSVLILPTVCRIVDLLYSAQVYYA